jgi:hypothetical protein
MQPDTRVLASYLLWLTALLYCACTGDDGPFKAGALEVVFALFLAFRHQER